jgi:hypothetical protein
VADEFADISAVLCRGISEYAHDLAVLTIDELP